MSFKRQKFQFHKCCMPHVNYEIPLQSRDSKKLSVCLLRIRQII